MIGLFIFGVILGILSLALFIDGMDKYAVGEAVCGVIGVVVGIVLLIVGLTYTDIDLDYQMLVTVNNSTYICEGVDASDNGIYLRDCQGYSSTITLNEVPEVFNVQLHEPAN